MAENLTLARPYADAAFSLAQAGNALENLAIVPALAAYQHER